MATIFHNTETTLESTAHSEGQEDHAIHKQYLANRNVVLQFLQSNLSPEQLQCHQNKVELLKKCYFYLDFEPKHINTRDQNHVMHRIDIMQIINPLQLQQIKKVGKKQAEIQLLLLTELLEQLERGREELTCYVETYDMVTFLSRWDIILQRLSKLSEIVGTFLSSQVPGKLYVKQHLVSESDLGGAHVPRINLSLSTKMPLIFDRRESLAHKNWAKLKWFTENQKPQLEPCELQFKLLTDESQAEVGYSRSQEVICNTYVVRNLKPGRSYEFTIRRSHTRTLVHVNWHDSITLTTKPNTVEDK